jgi:hypothetical protein
LPQRSVPVPSVKVPDPKNGDWFAKVEPELELLFFSKWETLKKQKRDNILSQYSRFSEYLPIFETNTNNFELWF